MEKLTLTPEQMVAYRQLLALQKTASESIKSMIEVAEAAGLAEEILVFSIVDVNNFNEDGTEKEEATTNRNISAAPDWLEHALASTAADQRTPWLCKSMRNASYQALEIKTFSMSDRFFGLFPDA